jgi:tol-pal system protein YbgF
MIQCKSLLFVISLACLFPCIAGAEAPVIEESENYALLDNDQAAFEQPDVHVRKASPDSDEEYALANDHEENSHLSATGKNVELLNKLQGLQQEVQELRGQLEIQAHELKLLQQQQLSFYKDLDARLRHETPGTSNPMALGQQSPGKALPTPLEKSTSPTPLITQVTNNNGRGNPADEQISYLAAYELVKNKKFDEALTAMQAYVKQYPQGGYSANAHYWLGELYMVKKNYPEAIQHFDTVLQQFPSSSKSAASLLKVGYAFAAQGNKQEAILRLQQVIKNYPDTNTAQLAKAKLDTLGR